MTVGRSRPGALVALAFACGLGACASASPAKDPSAILRAYGVALAEGRADDAYRMLSDDARRGTSLEAFRRMVKDDPEQVRDIGKSLERPTAPPVVTAKVVAPDGQELDLVLEKGAWRIDAAAIDLYAQDSPRHAVQGFVRALERKRYDVILRYVPDGHKEGIDAQKLKESWEGGSKDEMEQVLSSLKQALPGSKFEETGDHATFAYGAGTMQLVREHGLWKIEDFD
ncbi:MAG: hypothetical protein ACLQVI_33975 [Polyangiaceae bacterium]|jgi:hypothetical protein